MSSNVDLFNNPSTVLSNLLTESFNDSVLDPVTLLKKLGLSTTGPDGNSIVSSSSVLQSVYNNLLNVMDKAKKYPSLKQGENILKAMYYNTIINLYLLNQSTTIQRDINTLENNTNVNNTGQNIY